MSEFHPNRQKLVRTRPRLTARRIRDSWPFLVWIAVAFIAWRVYRTGVVFTRMNGAVDPYTENITPNSDGHLLAIHAVRGQTVPPGTVVAVMDVAPFSLKLEGLRREIVEKRTKDIRDYDSELIRLQSYLRGIETGAAEDAATIEELQKAISEIDKQTFQVRDPRLRQVIDDSILRSRVSLAKAQKRAKLNEPQNKDVTDSIDRTKLIRNTFQKEAETINKLDLGSDELIKSPSKLATAAAELAKSPALRADEQQQCIELKTKIELCELKTTHGGTVDRVLHEVGEYVKVGDGVLKIVGAPEHIICFLPQDQAKDLKKDDTVWVASTSDEGVLYESTIEGLSPRINNLPDSTSPLPNRRIHGRDVIVKYPPGAMPKKPGDPFELLPGQTLIIHTKKPGQVPWLDRIFHNDDSDKVR